MEQEEDSLPCLEQPVTDSYPESDESNPYPPTLFSYGKHYIRTTSANSVSIGWYDKMGLMS
jgi:hypothetical protein